MWSHDYDFLFADTHSSFEVDLIHDMNWDMTAQHTIDLHHYSHEMGDALKTLQENYHPPARTSSPQPYLGVKRLLINPPSPEIYDQDIINTFLRIFATHVAPTFTSFVGFLVRDNILPELVLAMAAVGGLFCGVPQSFTVAKAMYNDARRILLTLVITVPGYFGNVTK